MSLFLITGVAGAGKTTVWQELKARGFKVYDTDEDGFARWQNNKTCYIYPKSSVKKEARTEEFLKMHSWIVPRQEVEKLATQANNENIFLCGVASNEDEIRDLFDVIFELVIDEKTLRHRLLTRENNDWGKQPHELQKSLEDLNNATRNDKNFLHIDATRPIKSIVDEIVRKAR